MSDIINRPTPTDAEYAAEFEFYMREIDRILDKMEQRDVERERQQAEAQAIEAQIFPRFAEIRVQDERLWGSSWTERSGFPS